MSKTGRPSKYNQATADKICEHIAEGFSLRTFCGQDGNPSQSMVYRWLNEKPEFREQYTRAREDQAETYADQIVNIADTEEDANKARVRIDARKWVASKLLAKKYGDKSEVNVNANHQHHHTAEPVSESARWLEGVLGSGSDRAAKKPLH